MHAKDVAQGLRDQPINAESLKLLNSETSDSEYPENIKFIINKTEKLQPGQNRVPSVGDLSCTGKTKNNLVGKMGSTARCM
jgi:hypothetical protein